MGQSITYPDGSVLLSSALSLSQINAVWQPIVCGMLGITEPATTSLVRIKYPTAGAPFQDIADDVVYIACYTKDSPYDKIRYVTQLPGVSTGGGYGEGPYGQIPYGGGGNSSANIEQWNYTRSWTIHFTLYGPNSLDNARALRSGVYQDYFTEQLSLSQLFPVSDFPETVRVPEILDGQWIERVDFEFECYEFVTETINRQTVISVEVIVETTEVNNGEYENITVSDFVVEA